jgi:hypothetical protein
LWEYVLGGASLFALIVGLFALYIGRATRKMLMEEERATRELMERISKELVGRQMRGSTKMDVRFAEMDRRFEALLLKSSEEHKAILEAIKKGSEEHKVILEAIKEAVKRLN